MGNSNKTQDKIVIKTPPCNSPTEAWESFCQIAKQKGYTTQSKPYAKLILENNRKISVICSGYTVDSTCTYICSCKFNKK